MKRVLIVGAALIAGTTCSLAADFFVAQDSTTKNCMVVDTKPTSGPANVIGNPSGYATREDAQAAMRGNSSCTTAQGARVTNDVTGAIPASGGMSMNHYYNQNVYDETGTKIGAVDDMVIGNDGKISGFIVGVGGFIGVGEKYVFVPFNAVQSTTKDSKPWLSMRTTKADLQAAPGYTTDSTKMNWVRATN